MLAAIYGNVLSDKVRCWGFFKCIPERERSFGVTWLSLIPCLTATRQGCLPAWKLKQTLYVSTEPYCGIRSFLSVFFSRLALQHDKTSSAFLCLPAVSTSTAQVAGAHGFLGREIRAGNDDSLWKGYRREGEAGQMKFNNCDLDIQLKKQQPKSVIQVSCSSLQGDCTKETVPRQRGLPRHCTTHSCEIILSKCVNMQNRSLMHFSSSPLHDCNVPPPPSVQLNQQNSAAQTPPGSRHATPFPRQREDSKIHARL